MGTRCTVSITSFYDVETCFYRHWDGYPEATGHHLARVLKNGETFYSEPFALALLSSKEGDDFSGGRYELTSGHKRHCDTEWRYHIKLRQHEGIAIVVHHRPLGEDWQTAFTGDLPAYRKWIAESLVQYRQRAAQRPIA